ncbi:MAG TPA: hypothetical protein VGG10_08665 [Rhizomicrobium sp.]|jgi:uncharacterized protein with von Willebrand factor type A (vWA) domain
MGLWAQIGKRLAEAYRENRRFLDAAFGSRTLIGDELRELVGRDLAILVHKRNKRSEDNESSHQRWRFDLEAFIARSLRPCLAGRSVIALWSDGALMRALDALVADEQTVLARIPVSLPVTCRSNSHWAN